MTKFIRISCVAGLSVLMLCLFACDQKADTKKKAEKPQVVSKAIELPEKPVEKVPESVPAKPETPGADLQAAPIPPKPMVLPASTDQARQAPEAAEPPKTTEIAGNAKVYDSKGRLDPFIPLLSEKKEPEPVVAPVAAKPERMLTPLEKMDLSQIKLVAVIEMAGRSIAMVEEASGKGYEVKIGTYIGRNGGKVSAITGDGIVVKEIVQDFKGNRRERFQEIKFNKSEGN